MSSPTTDSESPGLTVADVAKINADRKEFLVTLNNYTKNLYAFQSKIFIKVDELKMTGDAFYDFSRYDEHLKLSKFFSDNTTDTNLQAICAQWDELFGRIMRLKVRYHPYYVPLPKMLAAYCILEGQYTRAVCLLYNAVQLRLIDMSSWFTLLWWVIYLQDWNMLGFLLRREAHIMENAARGDGYGLYVECCWLVLKLHAKQCPLVAKSIADKLRDICTNDKRTFMFSHCKILLRKALMYASRIECISLAEIGDPLHNCNNALDNCDLILHSRLPQFVKQEISVSDYLLQKLPPNDDFVSADELLRIFSTVADYFELSQECSSEMLEVGLVRESDCFAQTAWKHAILFAVPYRAISALSQVIYIRTMAMLERDMLGKYGACLNALLTQYWRRHTMNLQPSNVAPDKENSVKKTIEKTTTTTRALRSSSRQQANEDYSLIIEEVASSIESYTIVDTEQPKSANTVPEVPRPHNRPCVCAVCAMINVERRPSNWRMALQAAWIALIFEGYQPTKFEEFRRKCLNIRRIVVAERKSLCVAIKAPDLKEFVTPEFLEPWIRAATCVLVNKSEVVKPLADSARTLYLEEMLEFCQFAPLKFRSYSLLFNLLKNEISFKASMAAGAESADDDDDVMPPTPCTALIRPPDPTTSIEKELHYAYMDYKRYGHLFFRQWRQRNCLFLGRNLQTLTHKALFMLEVATPAVRQCARMCQHERRRVPLEPDGGDASAEFDFYFKTTAQFSSFVSNLPRDITLVNLVVDHMNTLWLIRCHALHEPIVLPVAKVGEDDEVLLAMQEILDQNNESLSMKLDATTFWRIRRQLDSKIEELIHMWQESWFGDLAPLLTPLGHEIATSDAASVKKIEAQLAKLKISHSFITTLTRLCGHIPKKQWEALVNRLLKGQLSESKIGEIFRFHNILRKAVVPGAKNYTLLVVPPQLNFLPWECLSIFEKAPLVSRIPSVHFFSYLVNKTKIIPKQVDGRKSYYVLNPGGDLENTEKRISVFVERFRWNGIVGKVPTKSEIKKALATHDLFLYVGHGSGGRYFGRSCIRQSDCRAVSVLMGCSSGCIQDLGPTFDGRGSIYEYLIAKCPCLIGCLWTVTDGEIDRFFIALMEYCFGKPVAHDNSRSAAEERMEKSAGTPLLPTSVSRQRRKSGTPSGKEKASPNKLNNYRLLVEGVTEARKICKLPFLTGASVVSYGLPIIPRFSSGETNSQVKSPPLLLIDE